MSWRGESPASRHDSHFMIYIALKGSIPKPAQSSTRPPGPGVLGPSGAGETFTMIEVFSQDLRRPQWLPAATALQAESSSVSPTP